MELLIKLLKIDDIFSIYTLAFVITIWIGLEILNRIVPFLFDRFDKIEIRGKHLDSLEPIDKLFVFVNKCLTVVFVYHLKLFLWSSKSIKWASHEVTVLNTFVAFISFYLFYDFFYMLFHRFLHVRSVYGFVHKHHHRQKAPSRGNIDAINVHPFEFVVGEYLHLVTIHMIPCHVYAVTVFILLGGVLASLNHTRFDVNIPGLYSVKVHDVHHRLPESNYGQYTMFWDKIFGSYRSYSENTGKAD